MLYLYLHYNNIIYEKSNRIRGLCTISVNFYLYIPVAIRGVHRYETIFLHIDGCITLFIWITSCSIILSMQYNIEYYINYAIHHIIKTCYNRCYMRSRYNALCILIECLFRHLNK